MSRVQWRWAERDFGFRFRGGGGKTRNEFYQASEPNEFYTVPAKFRKLSKERINELASQAPTAPRVVPIPWKNYERDWDRIVTDDGLLLNFAGCLDPEEIYEALHEVGRSRPGSLAFHDQPAYPMRASYCPPTIHIDIQRHEQIARKQGPKNVTHLSRVPDGPGHLRQERAKPLAFEIDDRERLLVRLRMHHVPARMRKPFGTPLRADHGSQPVPAHRLRADEPAPRAAVAHRAP
jgi:hypothetical protein